jgi:hypothetical protein
MKKVMYIGLMILLLHLSLQCSSQDSKKTGQENGYAVVIGRVIARLDLSTLQTRVFTQRVDDDQQALLETSSTSAASSIGSNQPLSMSRGLSFHSKADVLRLSGKQ